MLGWLYRVLVGRFRSCNHRWVIIEQTKLVRVRDLEYAGIRYTLQCEKCGNLKEKVCIS
jgi:hypothetical protein